MLSDAHLGPLTNPAVWQLPYGFVVLFCICRASGHFHRSRHFLRQPLYLRRGMGLSRALPDALRTWSWPPLLRVACAQPQTPQQQPWNGIMSPPCLFLSFPFFWGVSFTHESHLMSPAFAQDHPWVEQAQKRPVREFVLVLCSVN